MDDLEQSWHAWREQRETQLRDPRGWLAITAIHWLGADPERYDDAPGAWSGDAEVVEVVLRDDEELVVAGEVLRGGVHRFGPLDVAGVQLGFGDAVAQLAARDGSAILRPRHPDSPGLTAYRGTPCYPPDPAWVKSARYEPYAAPDGDATGELVLEHGGEEHRLVAWGEEDGSLWVLFRDATSGVTTYPANRQLVTPPPAAEGTVEVDLNRAFNMPCAYTDFATCPVAPEQNTLPFAVEAGERLPDLGTVAVDAVGTAG